MNTTLINNIVEVYKAHEEIRGSFIPGHEKTLKYRDLINRSQSMAMTALLNQYKELAELTSISNEIPLEDYRTFFRRIDQGIEDARKYLREILTTMLETTSSKEGEELLLKL